MGYRLSTQSPADVDPPTAFLLLLRFLLLGQQSLHAFAQTELVHHVGDDARFLSPVPPALMRLDQALERCVSLIRHQKVGQQDEGEQASPIASNAALHEEPRQVHEDQGQRVSEHERPTYGGREHWQSITKNNFR